MSGKIFGVCGAGTMGIGIAYAAAAAGYDVKLYDLNDEILERGQSIATKFVSKGVDRGKITSEEGAAILGCIVVTTNLNDLAGASVVVEAIVERLDIKQDLFKRLESIVPADAILATNTSSLPVTEIANALKAPERVVGMHFFNPAHIMKLVEVIQGFRSFMM